MSPRKTQIGVARECHHPKARHQHGSHVTYQRDGCGCDACTTAFRRWRKAADVARSRGQQNRVDGARARAHLATLLAAGVTVGQIQARSGVNRTTVRTLLGTYPGKKRAEKVTRVVEQRILAVQPYRRGPETRGVVDPTGTARRLQALVANGWDFTLLGAELGMPRNTLSLLAHQRRAARISTRDAVSTLYDRLWDQLPPANTQPDRRARTITRAYAQRYGWVPPLAWDDDTIDDPAAQPAHDLQPDLAPGEKPRHLTIHPDDVEFLADQGLPRTAIAEQLGVQAASLQISLERQDRRDLWERLCEREQTRQTTHHRRAA